MTEKTLKTQGRSGNTKTATTKTKVESRNRQYVFTLNNYESTEITSLIAWLENRKKIIYCFQEETGENGTKHLQGCFKCNDAIPFSTVKNCLPRAHIEVCKNFNKAFEYSCKPETRTGKIYSNEPGMVERCQPPEDYFNMDIATKWQTNILKMLEYKPHPRKLLWIYDKHGNSGKTFLCRHICIKYPRQSLLVSGKGADIKYTIKTFLENKKNNLKIVMFDIPRSSLDYISYTAIEEIKNGIFCSNKYESGMCVMKYCHVIIFANEKPQLDEMSKDRWVIWDISNKETVEDQMFEWFDDIEQDKFNI